MRSQEQLANMLEDIEQDSWLEITDHEISDDWCWIDIKVSDPDSIAGSEIVATYINQHDFNLCSVDFENQIIRVNLPL